MTSRSPLLNEAIAGRLDGQAVTILDIDAAGLLVEHSISGLASPPLRRLQFRWENEEIEVFCSVESSVLQDLLSDRRQKVTWHARMQFDRSSDLSALQRAFDACHLRVMEAQHANLGAIAALEPASEAMLRIGSPVRGHKPGYLACLYRGGKWSTRESRSPDQPLDGFTIAEFEDEHQIRILMKAYEEADRQGRDLIRQFAAASLE
jgi:hypothetical protein